MATGTKALLGYGRNDTKKVKPAAASGLPASSPIAAENHEIATMNAISTPAVASHSTTPAVGRNPISSATPITITVEMMLRSTLAATWPVRIAPAPISIERNLSMIPFFMSVLTLTAVCAEANPTQSRITPGTTYVTYFAAGVHRAAEQVHEDQHEHHRQRKRHDQCVHRAA